MLSCFSKACCPLFVFNLFPTAIHSSSFQMVLCSTPDVPPPLSISLLSNWSSMMSIALCFFPKELASTKPPISLASTPKEFKVRMPWLICLGFRVGWMLGLHFVWYLVFGFWLWFFGLIIGGIVFLFGWFGLLYCFLGFCFCWSLGYFWLGTGPSFGKDLLYC